MPLMLQYKALQAQFYEDIWPLPFPDLPTLPQKRGSFIPGVKPCRQL